MIRKTVSIDDHLYARLMEEGLLDQCKSFSELVSNALRDTLHLREKERYRRQLEAMASDPMVQEDIEAVQEDFRYADRDADAF